MEYTRHDAVIVTAHEYAFNGKMGIPPIDVEAFRASLPERWRPLLVGPIPAVVNHYLTYAFLPDGSKEGWDDSADGDTYRKQFIELFPSYADDEHGPYNVVSIRFGGDEPGDDREPELIAESNYGTRTSS